MPEVGALLADKYRVLSLLGEGGMGSVYRAENVLTGKHVALKWMHPQVAASKDASERLMREARAASKLSHPNVVDVYDIVQDGQTLFLVMELLQGRSLRDYLRSQAQPPIHELIGLLLGAMAGVAAAHAQGVIHRDLKPDNIFLVDVPGLPQPVAKVLDFGIAKVAELRGSTLTQTGAAIGTPVYMSLEQLRGDKDIDLRTDVYAFGVMLYEALVGRAPFTAETLSELAIKVATTDAIPAKTLRPDAPSGLCAIIDRAIRRDRRERWPDVPSLMGPLTAFAQPLGFREQMTFHDVTVPRVAAPSRRAALPRSAPELGWTATAGLPSPSQNTLPEPSRGAASSRSALASSDSLIARELTGAGRLKGSPLPIWLAAAALLAVTAVTALLLLSDRPAIKPPASVVRPLTTATGATEITSAAASAQAPVAPTLPTPSSTTEELHIEPVAPSPTLPELAPEPEPQKNEKNETETELQAQPARHTQAARRRATPRRAQTQSQEQPERTRAASRGTARRVRAKHQA